MIETTLPPRPANVSVAFVGGVATIERDYVGSGDDGSVLFSVMVSSLARRRDGHIGDVINVYRTVGHKMKILCENSGQYTTWVNASTSYGYGPSSYPLTWEAEHQHVGFN